MDMVYHGTSVEFALEIARDGALLSPLEKKIRDLHRTLGSIETVTEIERRAFLSAVSEHGDESRIRTVSVTPSLFMANAHAAAFDQHRGGVVLGFELDLTVLGQFGERWRELSVLLVPGRVSLEALRCVRLSGVTRESQEEVVRTAFDRYRPQYQYLCAMEKG